MTHTSKALHRTWVCSYACVRVCVYIHTSSFSNDLTVLLSIVHKLRLTAFLCTHTDTHTFVCTYFVVCIHTNTHTYKHSSLSSHKVKCVAFAFLLMKSCVCVYLHWNEALHPLKRSVTVTNGLSSRSASSPLLPPRISCAAQSAVPSHLIPALFGSGKYWRSEMTPGARRGEQEGSAAKWKWCSGSPGAINVEDFILVDAGAGEQFIKQIQRRQWECTGTQYRHSRASNSTYADEQPGPNTAERWRQLQFP